MSKYSIGTIWKLKDKLWSRNYKRGLFFAQNKQDEEGIHPAIIKRESMDDYSYELAPGTSKEQLGSCVFRTSINSDKLSYFILSKSMPVLKDELDLGIDFKPGWNDKTVLDPDQIQSLRQQNTFCKG